MKVKNLVFYQIATDRNYKVGDKLHFGTEDNFQAYRVYNAKLSDENGTFGRQGNKFVSSKKIFANKKLVSKLSRAADESDFVIRELAVEYVRKNKYPDKPSRLKCMFLTDDKELCLSGLKTFYKKGHGTLFQAVAVKLNGNIFFAKDLVMPRSGLSYSEYLDIADKYWSQNQKSKAKTQEILFEGDAEIVEILGEYHHDKK